jgi:hypothetical protein
MISRTHIQHYDSVILPDHNGSFPPFVVVSFYRFIINNNLLFTMNQQNFVCYESMKLELQIKPIYECRCNGRLQTKRFTRLTHTGLVVELEHLKIKTRLTNEKFVSVKGECEI